MKYTVTFTIFKKKMRVKVYADSKIEAKRKTIAKITSQINFNEITPDISDNDVPDFFKDIFNM